MKDSLFRLFWLLSFLVLLMPDPAFADAGVTYHGRLLTPNGSPVTSSSVQFLLQIKTPSSSNCLMYQETQVKDLSQTGGIFSITINDGSQTSSNTEPFTLETVFQNHGNTYVFPPGKCSGTSSVTFASDLSRQLVVFFNDGSFSGWEPLPAQEINFVPMALESVSLGGHKASNFFRVMDSGTLHTMSPWSSAEYQKLLDLVANTSISGGNASIGGNAAGFTGALAGDVTGGQASTRVEKIQGNAVLAGTPTDKQVLTWNHAQSRWEASNLPVAAAPDWNDITNRPTSLPPSGSAGGDLAGSTYPNPVIANNAITAAKINDGAVAFSKIAAGSVTGQVLQYEVGVGWKAGKLLYTDLIKSGGGSPWPSTACLAGEAVIWQSATDGFECAPISITETDPTVKGFAKNDPSSDFSTTGNVLALNTVPITRGGTGAVSQSAAINNLLPSQGGNAGKLLQTNGTNVSWADAPSSGITSINGATGAAQTFNVAQGETAPVFKTTGNTHTLNIPEASTSGVLAGTISYSDYQAFSGKQNALGFTPLNPANNLSELTATASTARSNLGLGTAATKNFGTSSGNLVELDGTGKIPASLLPSQSGTYFAQGGNAFGAPAVLGTIDPQPLHLQTGGTEKVTILNNGNVGIGTTSPSSYGLDVYRNTPGVGGIKVTNANPSAATYASVSVSNDTGVTGGMWLNSSGSTHYAGPNSLHFGTSNAEKVAFVTSNLPRLTIDSGGNVGIGTTSPNDKLDVAGRIRATHICASDGTNCKDLLSAWAGGSVTSVSGTAPIAVTGTSTPVVSLNAAGVTATHLANNAVTTAKITDGAVTDVKIDKVSVNKIQSGAGLYLTYAPNNIACANGQVLKKTANGWECGADSGITAETDPNVQAYAKNAPSADFTTPSGVLTLATVPISKGGTGATTAPAALTALLPSQASQAGKVLGTNGTAASWVDVTSGTVTSVTSANADISVANSTTAPVLTLNSGTGANQILKLNASSQIPAVSGALLTNLNAGSLSSGTLPAARLPGLTGDVTSAVNTNTTTVEKIRGRVVANTTPTNGQVLKWNDTLSQWEPSTDSAGTGTVTNVTGTAPISVATGGTTPVISLNAAGVTVTHLANGAVTSAKILDGTIATADLANSSVTDLKLASNAVTTVKIANGAVTDAKIAGVSVNKITSAASQYFTYAPNGTACTNGQVLKWSTTNSRWECGTDSTGGTVTSVTSANADIAIANSTTTPQLTLNVGTGANQILKLNASSQIPAVNGSLLTNLNAGSLSTGTLPVARLPALTGDVTMAAGGNTTSVVKIQGRDVTNAAPAANQVLKWNGAAWAPAADAAGTGTVTNVTGTAPITVANGASTPAISLAAAGVAESHLANNAVTSAKIANGTIVGADLNFTGVNGATSNFVLKDSTGKFANFVCSTTGHVPTWTVTGFSCQAPAIAETDPKVGANTTNMLSKWDGTKLVASGVYESGGNIGIGTSAPTEKLEIVGGKIKSPEYCIGSDCITSWGAASGGGAVWFSQTQSAAFSTTSTSAVAMGNISPVSIAVNKKDIVYIFWQCEVKSDNAFTLAQANIALSGASVDQDIDFILSNSTSTYLPYKTSALLTISSSGTLTFTPTLKSSNGKAFARNCSLDAAVIFPSSGMTGPWTTSGNDVSYVSGNVGIGTTAPSASLDVNGNAKFRAGINAAVRVVTAAGAVTVTTSDYIICINKTTGAATTVNLPADPSTGDQYIIKDCKGDANTNNITVAPASGNIDGAATYVLGIARQSIGIFYDGSQWQAF